MPREVRKWRKTTLPDGVLYTEPALPALTSRVGKDDRAVTLMGTCIEFGEHQDVTSLTLIAEKVLSRFQEQGAKEAISYISELGGRFLAVLSRPGVTTFVPDCHAALGAYWAASGDVRFVGSHPSLVALAAEAPESTYALGLMNSPDYVEPGGKYYPALLTPYEGVTPVFANSKLTLRGASARHERFYPVRPLPQHQSLDEAYAKFKNLLSRSVKAWASRGPSVLSLTAGLDSRAVLAAGLDWFRAVDTVAVTYLRFDPSSSSNIEDAMTANRLAERVGLRHRILSIDPFDPSSRFGKVYNRSFPRGARFPALAQSYARFIGPDETNLISTISETGTVFYREREDPLPTAGRLASKFTTSRLKQHPDLVKEFDRYIEYSAFTLDAIGDIDYHDLFYWEHRNSKWASLWYSETDLSHRVGLPFNVRALIEIMLSVPEEMRRDRYLLERLIEESGLSLEQ